MKKVFALLLLAVLASCGSSPSRTIPEVEQPAASKLDYENIIGISIKIGNLEVTQNDFPNAMNWDDAKKACEALGNGWRLPNKDELDFLYQKRFDIGGFTRRYWSSTESASDSASYLDCVNGGQINVKKFWPIYVRAIKSMTVTLNSSNVNVDVNSDNNTNQNTKPAEIIYQGTMTDNQSGISQDYTLYIKSDFSSASIGGGAYTRIEDQGNGVYMWLDGTIIGMSFKPMIDRCIVYGSDGGYFCTLYRR